jgi:hypothetical protein
MKRRASRPTLESIEDRVLTTIVGSPTGLTQGAHPNVETRQQVAWAALAVTNQTSVTVVYEIKIQAPGRAPVVRVAGLPAGGSQAWRADFIQGGTIPSFTVKFDARPRQPTSTTLEPSIFARMPDEQTIIRNAHNYKFRLFGGEISLGS